MTRNAKPVDLLLLEGRKHLTKDEIEHRKKSEIKIGTRSFRCPLDIKQNQIAYTKWRELMVLFRDIECITTADVDRISMYCKKYARLQLLVAEFEDAETEGITLNTKMQYRRQIVKEEGELKRIGDDLLLAPIARVKNIPKKEPEKVDPLNEMFGV